MKRFVPVGLALACAGLLMVSRAKAGPAEQLITAAARTSFAYQRLARLCDTFGPRFSGSTNLDAALDWILAEMKNDGLENVRGEEVTVPHWVRGQESAELIEPWPKNLLMLGLGGSIGTPAEGLTGEVLVVTNFADLRSRAQDAKGKIVVINQPFTRYGETVQIRRNGAIEAGRVGAVASLIRSVTPLSIQSPHTGAMAYSDGAPRIPHAAITVEDAAMLQRMQERGQKIVIRLKMSAATLPEATSRNAIAEVTGREHPEEVVLVSGHIDSWDVGQGALDDGGGAVAAWEAARLMRQLGLRPRRTVRVVLWTNEENGLAGARAYRRCHQAELVHHVLAIESDEGTFRPLGFSFVGAETALGRLRVFATPLHSMGADTLTTGEPDADVGQLRAEGVPTLGLQVEGSKYFWYHHTQADTIDKMDARELSDCAAALAVMAYQVADAPEPLPR